MYVIRQIRSEEIPVLDEFLYQAIFVPQGTQPPLRSIICKPELQVYLKDFGAQKDDHCLVAEAADQIVGAVWTRIMNDYGHVDADTPSFALSLLPEYRGQGIGTALMERMLEWLRECGYRQASLAVQKENYAARMYQKLGFEIIGENEEEYIMLHRLQRDD